MRFKFDLICRRVRICFYKGEIFCQSRSFLTITHVFHNVPRNNSAALHNNCISFTFLSFSFFPPPHGIADGDLSCSVFSWCSCASNDGYDNLIWEDTEI